MSKTPNQPKSSARSKTKKVQVIGLLERKSGSTMAQLIKATGWQPHTIRAALTRLRQQSMVIERSRNEKVSRYRLIGKSEVA